MRTQQKKERGAFGFTEIAVAPSTAVNMLFDITNCPHCGGHHASVDSELVKPDRIVVRCPSLGGAPLTMTVKLFLHPVG